MTNSSEKTNTYMADKWNFEIYKDQKKIEVDISVTFSYIQIIEIKLTFAYRKFAKGNTT